MAKTKSGDRRGAKSKTSATSNASSQAFDAAAIYGKIQAFMGLFVGLLIAIPMIVFGIWALRSGKEYRSTGIILTLVGSLVAIWVIVKAVLVTKYKGFAAASGVYGVLGGVGGGGRAGTGGVGINGGGIDLGGLINFGFVGR